LWYHLKSWICAQSLCFNNCETPCISYYWFNWNSMGWDNYKLPCHEMGQNKVFHAWNSSRTNLFTFLSSARWTRKWQVQ